MEGPPMNESNINDLISKTGFPIFVSIWFLWRLEKRLDRIFRVLYQVAGKVGVNAADTDQEDAS
jgi:hypothetical protein